MSSSQHQNNGSRRHPQHDQRPRNRATMLLPAILLASATTAQHHQPQRPNLKITRLKQIPQHRVRTPKRKVPYAQDHPHARHLQADWPDFDFLEDARIRVQSGTTQEIGAAFDVRLTGMESSDEEDEGQDSSSLFIRRRSTFSIHQNPRSSSDGTLTDNKQTQRRISPAARVPSRLIKKHLLNNGHSWTITTYPCTVRGTQQQPHEAESRRLSNVTAGNDYEKVSAQTDPADQNELGRDDGTAEGETQITELLVSPGGGNSNNISADDTLAVQDVNASHSDGLADPDDGDDAYYRNVTAGHFGDHKYSAGSTSVQSSSNSASNPKFRPIRISAVLTDQSGGGQYLNSNQREFLLNDVLHTAMHAWSLALSVVPVEGNLTIDPEQLYDGISCGPGLDSGLPSVVVPAEHTTTGIPDTDLVIYVIIGFSSSTEGNDTTFLSMDNNREDNETDSQQGTNRGGNNSPKTETLSTLHSEPYDMPVYGEVNETLFNDTSLLSDNSFGGFVNKTDLYGGNVTKDAKNQSHSASNGDGSANDSPTASLPSCSGSYLASATYCSTDQYDRPIGGMLHFCIDDTFFEKQSLRRNTVTAMHELGHILGFNSQSMAHFRRAFDGKPLTPRDKNGDVPDVEITCTGVKEVLKSAMVPLPSQDILQFRQVRGGIRVAQIVTPTVRQVARNHFDCQSLNGAELESEIYQPTTTDEAESSGSSVCLSDHLSRRVFKYELMNPVVDDLPFTLRISPLTLAYFIDCGWYQINVNRSSYVNAWGRAARCDFMGDKCITPAGEVSAENAEFFCNDMLSNAPGEVIEEIHGCTPDLSRKAICNMVEYNFTLPKAYRYFSEMPKVLNTDSVTSWGHFGGSDSDLDYCPVYYGFSNGLCNDKKNRAFIQVDRMEEFGEPNSRCVVGEINYVKTALCLPIACVIQDRTLRVKVDGYWKQCDFAGQIIQTWRSQHDYVVCPDPRRTCPTFYCLRDCLGTNGGICDYASGLCVCPASSVEDSDSSNNITINGVAYVNCTGNSTFDEVDFYDNVTRMEASLSDFYVTNDLTLKDENKDLYQRTSRMFSNMGAGEVIGFVTASILVVMACCLALSFFVKMSKSGIRLSNFSLKAYWRRDEWRVDASHAPRRTSTSRNSDKDKAVASLLVNMRIHDPLVEGRLDWERRERRTPVHAESLDEDKKEAEFAGQCCSTSVDDDAGNHTNPPGQIEVRRSEIPPLRGGRVVAIIGSRLIEDEVFPWEDHDDARSSTETIDTLNDSRSIGFDSSACNSVIGRHVHGNNDSPPVFVPNKSGHIRGVTLTKSLQRRNVLVRRPTAGLEIRDGSIFKTVTEETT